jgi:hypothetical protein
MVWASNFIQYRFLIKYRRATCKNHQLGEQEEVIFNPLARSLRFEEGNDFHDCVDEKVIRLRSKPLARKFVWICQELLNMLGGFRIAVYRAVFN